MVVWSSAHPGILCLLHFQDPLGSGKVIHLFEGLDLPQEGPHGRIIHRDVICFLLLLPTGNHGCTWQSHMVNCCLYCAPKATWLGGRRGLGHCQGT